jgi:hypothetical protein
MAWVEVVVAATESKRDRREKIGAVVAAALTLPGVIAPLQVRAESAPERGLVAIKYLDYQDWQPRLNRINVHAPAIYALVPISPKWSAEGSFVVDSVSGASPRWHTSVSGATKRVYDKRHAGDVKVTRYEERSTYSLGFSKSREHDYDSTAFSADASFSSDDNNRTWNVGLGYAHDKIGSTIDKTLNKRKRTTELMVGVTQAVSAADLVQVNASFNTGRGYYDDPYKSLDKRPNMRNQLVLLGRWNHYVGSLGATLRTSYRAYHDTYGIDAHTLGADWVQPVNSWFTVTPSVRLYTQSAADFYADPVYDAQFGAPFPKGYFTNPPKLFSADQRLAAFGAVTVGMKFAAQLSPDWSTDFKVERYEQRSEWRPGGGSSFRLTSFGATFLQVGLSKRF